MTYDVILGGNIFWCVFLSGFTLNYLMIEYENDFDKDKGILNILDLENRIWFGYIFLSQSSDLII